MRHLVEAWEADFTKFHPGISFDYQMHGTSSGIPALFTGMGDMAILGEEILPEASAAFEKVKGYRPLGIEIMTGSVDVRNFDYAQQFFVHKDNPLTHLDPLQMQHARAEWLKEKHDRVYYTKVFDLSGLPEYRPSRRLSGADVAWSADVARSSDVSFVDSLPLYAPNHQVRGTIRLWGHGSPKHDFMGKLVRNWTRTFNGYQPAVNFDNRMYGTASAIGALYTGAGDLAILGEEVSPAAAAAFKRAKSYAPTCVQIATGSLDVNYFDYAHMIFVHKDNPIDRLTVAQLEAIFGTEHRRSEHNIRRWGELGLGEEWKDQDIHPYAWKVDDDFALFFRERVLDGSHRWNPDIREYVTIKLPDGSVLDRGQQIIDALSQDRYGIAISNLRFANASVKVVALAAGDGGAYYAPTPNNLIDRSYPLTRLIPACIDRKPGEPVDPLLREFLRFLLSREGQRALLQDSGYLPLGAQAIRAQLAMIQ
jgi:phosphate transport system substrate-binding protein